MPKDVIPTFNFCGQCEEAINLYKKAFNAKTAHIIRYGEINAQEGCSDADPKHPGYIYHAELAIGKQRIMMCDISEFKITHGLGLFLTVIFPSAPKAIKAFEYLSLGGTIIFAPQKTTYSPYFVSLTDKFGVRWNLMAEYNPNAMLY